MRYIPGAFDLIFQGMPKKISRIEQPAHLSYNDKETLDFELILVSLEKSYYTNLKSLEPSKVKKINKFSCWSDTSE